MSEENLEKWWKVSETAKYLNLSERAVIERVKLGKLTAKREGKRWLIEPQQKTEIIAENVGNLKETNEFLKRQLEEKDKQIAEKDKQISELHVLLGRRALTEGQESRHWWTFWRK
jgi:hypothetical protein